MNLPDKTRGNIPRLDYSLAESRCPQKIAIGKLMRSAAR
jgi:hypothetical protein